MQVCKWLPHIKSTCVHDSGTFQDAGVNKYANCLNSPLFVKYMDCDEDIQTNQSFFSVSTDQVVLETVKTVYIVKNLPYFIYIVYMD